MGMKVVVAVVVGLTIAAIAALFYLTVLDIPPQPLVVGLVGVLGGAVAARQW